MNEDTCLYTGGVGRHGPALPSRSRRFSVRMLTCAGALLALYGAAPVYAFSGFPPTGQVYFIGGDNTKIFCNWSFDPDLSPSLPACALHNAKKVAVQADSNGFQLVPEADVTIQFTTHGRIATLTKVVDELPAPRNAVVCETAGDASEENHCVTITEGEGDIPSACPPKFPIITSDADECAADLLNLQEAVGPTAAFDFTLSYDDDPRLLNINVCHTPASWACNAAFPIANSKQVQEIGFAHSHTPGCCIISGTQFCPCPRR